MFGNSRVLLCLTCFSVSGLFEFLSFRLFVSGILGLSVWKIIGVLSSWMVEDAVCVIQDMMFGVLSCVLLLYSSTPLPISSIPFFSHLPFLII